MRIKLFESFMDDVFRSAHASIDKKDLVPLDKMLGKPNFPTKNELDAAIKYLDLSKEDEKHFFYSKTDMLTPIIYWKGPFYYGFTGGLNMEALTMLRAKEYFEHKTKFISDCLSKKDYNKLFMRVDKKILIPTFMDIYNEIPDDQKYDVFIDLYQRSEYGFGMFDSKIIKDVFSKNKYSKERIERMNAFTKKAKLNPDGTISVFRGENTGSAKEEAAFSWTLSKKTADFFANRFSKGTGKIIKKNIDPESVIDYLSNRGEAEVLLMPIKFLKESRRIRLFEDFDVDQEPIALAILGSPAGGKSYAKKLITHITKLVKIARAADPEISMDLTVDILRGKILELPASDQLDLFYMAFYTIKELAEESNEFAKWFSDIKDVWANKIAKQMNVDVNVSDDDLKINGKTMDKALDELKKVDADKIIKSLDNYQDYKRIVRAYQQIKQKEALGTHKDVVYDEVGDEPEKIVNNMNKLHNKDYVTDVIMIHHDDVSNNLIQNASRMIMGSDGGRDASASIIDAYSSIDKNLDTYKNNAKVSITTTNKELQNGEGDAPDALASATHLGNGDKGDKAIDVFIRTKGDDPKEIYKNTTSKMDSEQIQVFNALLKYQIESDKIKVPEKSKKTIQNLLGDLSDSEALDTLKDANSGKLKNKYVYQFGGIDDKLIASAEKTLTY